MSATPRQARAPLARPVMVRVPVAVPTGVPRLAGGGSGEGERVPKVAPFS